MRSLIILLGIALVAVGLGILAWQEVAYTTQEKTVEVGPIAATPGVERSLELPPGAGAISLLCGVGLLLVVVRPGRSRRRPA